MESMIINKRFFSILLLILFHHVILAQTTYTFTGNGNWSLAGNWSNNTVPPNVVSGDNTIIISPVTGGNCILNVPQTISQAGNLIISPMQILSLQGD